MTSSSTEKNASTYGSREPCDPSTPTSRFFYDRDLVFPDRRDVVGEGAWIVAGGNALTSLCGARENVECRNVVHEFVLLGSEHERLGMGMVGQGGEREVRRHGPERRRIDGMDLNATARLLGVLVKRGLEFDRSRDEAL